MIYFVTGNPHLYDWDELEDNGIVANTAVAFGQWIDNYDDFLQVDTETPITSHVYGWLGRLKGVNKEFDPVLDADGNRIPMERKCYVAQFGDAKGENQWVFDVPSLTPADIKEMCKGFTYRSTEKKKLIHNFLFDYAVVKWNFGIDMNGVIDTFMMSKSVTSGLEVGVDLPAGYNGLAGCALRYLGIDLSKAEQTTFDGVFLTVAQIRYAAIDVAVLKPIYDCLAVEVEQWGLWPVVTLESAVARSYGDAMCENLYLDPEPWTVKMEQNYADVVRIRNEFFELMKEHFPKEIQEPFELVVPNKNFNKLLPVSEENPETLVKHIPPFIQKNDEYQFEWSGRKQKQEIMFYLYPDMPKNFSKKEQYKGYYDLIMEENNPDVNPKYLDWILNGDYDSLGMYLISKHKAWLTEQGIFVPKGTILINLNSDDQKLALFRLIDPTIKNTNKETIAKMRHPLAMKLKEYMKASKMYTSYGQNFLDAINPDGMFRVQGFTQILNTGRSSMSLMQLLPQDNTYRNPFVPNDPKTGVRADGYSWKVVGADYASQELCVMATFSGEESMLEALRKGYDLHSMNTARLFPEKWAALGGTVPTMGKPDDPTLKKLRDNTKATIFGIAYGKSAIGLGETLNIPGTTEDLIQDYAEEYEAYMEEHWEDYMAFVRTQPTKRDTKHNRHDWIKGQHKSGAFLGDVVTGDDMIARVFSAMPDLEKFLTSSAEEAATTRVIRTPDIFQRTRRFAVPQFDSGWNAIKRQGQNYKIQGSSANMTKLAICYIKVYIEENNLQDRMKFVLPLHDEIRYIAREDFAEEALEIVLTQMRRAGKVILGTDMQDAEGEITDKWYK